jgi:hypothetical protein
MTSPGTPFESDPGRPGPSRIRHYSDWYWQLIVRVGRWWDRLWHRPKRVPGAAFRCEICGIDPLWSITRRGDVAISWACPEHMSQVCSALQRDHEITQLVVTHMAKSHEWAEIGETLRKIGDGS